MLKFAERLKELSLKYNYSQSDIAKKIGITPQAVGKLMSEKAYPSLETLIKLRKVFNSTIDYLLGLDLIDEMDQMYKPLLNVGEKVKEIRTNMKYGQRDFAKLIDIKLKELEDIENGITPPIDLLERIAINLGVDISLFTKAIYSEEELIESQKIRNFALNIENTDYIKKIMKAKEKGLNPDEIVIAKKEIDI